MESNSCSCKSLNCTLTKLQLPVTFSQVHYMDSIITFLPTFSFQIRAVLIVPHHKLYLLLCLSHLCNNWPHGHFSMGTIWDPNWARFWPPIPVKPCPLIWTWTSLCSFDNCCFSGKAFHNIVGLCLWEFVPMQPKKYSWGQAWKLDKKAWLPVSILIPPSGVQWDLGHGSWSVNWVPPHHTRLTMSLWTSHCAQGTVMLDQQRALLKLFPQNWSHPNGSNVSVTRGIKKTLHWN